MTEDVRKLPEDLAFSTRPIRRAAARQKWTCPCCGEALELGAIAPGVVVWTVDGRKRWRLFAGHPDCVRGAELLGSLELVWAQAAASLDDLAATRAKNALKRVFDIVPRVGDDDGDE